jgi:enoyl-CoA hydratase/carnithine racemase
MIIDQRSDHVVVTFDRPSKRNSMDLSAWTALREAVEHAATVPANRAVVVRGDARSFCAGNDIDSMRALDTPAAGKEYFITGMLPTFRAIAASPLPVVAVVEGSALGGGVEIVTWSDIVIAGPHATFGLPETRIGVWATVFFGAMPSSSTRRLGARMALAGDAIGALEAKELGLVTYAVEDVEAKLADVLAGVSAGAPDAVARSKRWLNRELLDEGVVASAAALTELSEHTLPGEEFAGRMADFLAAKEARAAARAAAR